MLSPVAGGRRRGDKGMEGKGTGREETVKESEAWRGGGIITGERELPEGEIPEMGGEDEEAGSGG